MLKNKLFAAMGGSEPTDPNFKNTVLLLHGDGTNGAQNNTFIDSSPNNFTITRNGNVTQGSFSPYGTLWSNYFDGTGDYLTAPATGSAFNISTGDFTIESWVYMSNSVNGTVAALNKGSGVDGIYFVHGGGIYVTSNSSSWDIINLATIPGITANAWNHVALVRNGNNWNVYLNGTSVHSVTSSSSISFTGTRLFGVGATGTGGVPLTGYISNLRIVKGTALYTTNFTPPTAPLTAVAGTSLLCCQDNRFKDNSVNNFTMTPNGDVAVTPFSPFANSAAYNPAVNGGSGYFDGSGDYITAPAGTSFVFPGDFTIDCWVYPQRVASGNTERNLYILGTYFGLNIVPGVSMLVFLTNAATFTVTDVVPKYDEWSHIAYVRSGGVAKLYVNGKASSTTLSNSSTAGSSTVPFPIGALPSQANTYGYKGYISDFRIVKGTALYTSNFTPPTAPLTAVTNTQLLTNFTNAGIYDNTGMNNLETVGNAQVSTTVKKYGTGAMYFDGSGDYLQASQSNSLAPGAGDFTVEMWLYPSGAMNFGIAWQNAADSNSAADAIRISTNSTDETSLAVATAGTTLMSTATGTLGMNSWSHVALVRSGTTLTLFVNGVSAASATNSTNFANPNCQIGGGIYSAVLYPWVGYIDDLRITKGVARYTANFTPPAQAFPNK